MKEDVDKIVQTLKDIPIIYADVAEAKESGDEVTWIEGGTLVVKHGGKLIRFVSSLEEIVEELKDLTTEETSEIIKVIEESYEVSNDQLKIGIMKLIQGAVYIKEGSELVIKATK